MEFYSHEKDVFKTPEIEQVRDMQHGELPPSIEKKNYVLPEHLDYFPEVINEVPKEKIPPVFLMNPKARSLYLANGEYDLGKITEKIKRIAQESVDGESVNKKPEASNPLAFFEKNHPEIKRIIREDNILEAQRKLYERFLSKVILCAGKYPSNALDQIHISSKGEKVFVEDVTLAEKEQQKRLTIGMLQKDQEMNRELLATKEKGFVKIHTDYTTELKQIGDKNTVLKEREKYETNRLNSHMLKARIEIESVVAEVLQNLTALGEHIPAGSFTLEEILHNTEKLLQAHIGHMELSKNDKELLEEYNRIAESINSQ